MRFNLNIEADRDELSEIIAILEQLETSPDVTINHEEEEAQPVTNLTDEERFVIASLHANPRSALRVVHRLATELRGSPFDDFDEDNGWNDERQRIRDLLWSMKSDGLVHNDGQLWYATDEAPLTNLQ